MNIQAYNPGKQILDKYADVLINFALNSGEGVKEGEVVLVQIPESAKPFYAPLRDTILRAGANPIMQYLAEEVDQKNFYDLANQSQLDFFPEKFMRGRIDAIDHRVVIISEANKFALKGVSPKKLFRGIQAMKPYKEWENQKETQGQFTWTLALYGTQAMAEDVEMTIEEYWDQILQACYLHDESPVQTWMNSHTEINRIILELDKLKIDRLHILSENIDLIVGLGEGRRWMGGSGRNIPSFEIFISPDWRRTNGHAYFNQPLYYFGESASGISLEFKDGLVIDAKAKEGEQIIQQMVQSENANKIGEFSLTDSRFSKITRIMGETLYDENIGGPEGNTHIAIGNAYRDSYPGDSSQLSEAQWEELGYNKSSIHTDIISTEKRKVTAYLVDGSQMVIYQDGKFTL